MLFKRIRHGSKRPRKSTLDIIDDVEVTASQLEMRSQTGDILMWGNDMREAPEWYKLIQSAAGKTTLERRMPILHVACIIKNPPKEILDYYGLEEDPDGFQTYVFEGVPPNPRMMHLKAWIKDRYKPELPGSAAFWRRRESPEELTPPDALWEWLKEAKSLPYAMSAFMSATWQGMFFMWVLEPSSFPALLNIYTKIARRSLQGSLGTSVVPNAFAHVGSWCASVLIFTAFLATIVYFGIPLLFRVARKRLGDGLNIKFVAPHTRGYGVHKDGSLKFMICSVAAAETIRRMGLFDEENGPHPSILLPKDFLPQQVGGDFNLYDVALKEGVAYSENLIRIANPYQGTPQTKFIDHPAWMLKMVGRPARNLGNAMALTEEAMGFDMHAFQRGLVSGNNKEISRNSGLLSQSELVANSNFDIFDAEPVFVDSVRLDESDMLGEDKEEKRRRRQRKKERRAQ